MIQEFSYLSTKNTDQYILVMDLFLSEFEKVNVRMDAEEVFHKMKEEYPQTDLNLEGIIRALDYLTANNDLSVQEEDLTYIRTLEEYKKRKRFFSITRQGVFVARNFREFLKTTDKVIICDAYFERVLDDITNCHFNNSYLNRQVLYKDAGLVFQIYQDFLSDFNRSKLEQISDTKEFLAYKKSFMDSLQRLMEKLRKYAKEIAKALSVLDVIEDGEMDRIRAWFLYQNDQEPAYISILEYCSSLIEKMVRRTNMLLSVKKEQKDFSDILAAFMEADNLGECQQIYARHFGCGTIRHFNYHPPYTLSKREQKIREVHEEEPYEGNDTAENQRASMELMKKEAAKEEKLFALSKDNTIDLGELGRPLESEEVETLLGWISDGLNDEERKGKTHSGQDYQIVEGEGEPVSLDTEEGVLFMKPYKIQLLDSF